MSDHVLITTAAESVHYDWTAPVIVWRRQQPWAFLEWLLVQMGDPCCRWGGRFGTHYLWRIVCRAQTGNVVSFCPCQQPEGRE